MNTLLAFAFVLGVLVFVHELGHFLMARWHGVRVLVFSLGFGPKLLKVRRGDTEYAISAIPLGGYVKMAGETPEDQRTGSADEFLSKNKWQRFQILIMGPLMNLALAVVLLAIVLMQGTALPQFYEQAVVIGKVTKGSVAEGAGLRPGDRILRVGGDNTDTWESFFMEIGRRAERDVPLTVVRDGREQTINVTPVATGRYDIGDIGVLPDVNPSIARLVEGQPAIKAGFKVGDLILAVNGDRVVFSSDVVQAIEKSPGTPVTIQVRRDGQAQDIQVVPEKVGEVGKIGIEMSNPSRIYQPGPLEAIGLSVQRNIEGAGLILKTVWELITGETSPKQLMGPIGIAQVSGESAQAGWIALFALMATISLNLGLLNLLPIPVLDGGHILIMGLEAVARRDFSMQTKEKMFLAGFVLLMALMVTVIYNDLTRISWFERLMPWRN